jgi:methylated-DNA-protein-cysteine methyltransferase-like protein
MGARRGRAQPRHSSRLHGHVAEEGRTAWAAVYDIVRTIPCGRVMTYGQVSVLLGHTLSPVAVGWALHVCPDDVPWHRVVNASGGCSTSRLPDLPPDLQRRLLEAEGVEFRLDGTLDLRRFRCENAETMAPGAR